MAAVRELLDKVGLLVAPAGQTDSERRSMTGHRWWSADEPERTTETVRPLGLAGLVADVRADRLRGHVAQLPWNDYSPSAAAGCPQARRDPLPRRPRPSRVEHVFDSSSLLSIPVLRTWLSGLAGRLEDGVSGAELIDEIAVLERVKAGCAARQARLTVAFDQTQQAEQAARGVPAAKLGQGVAEQVALARRESPAKGSGHLETAKALVHDMPSTLAALSDGDIGEWTASSVVKETACLSAEQRRAVDGELADRLRSLGPGRARAAAWAAACRLDPASAVVRCRKAVDERRVWLSPAPDSMTRLTALLPVRDGVAVCAALDAAAGAARAQGDRRSRGQVMADTLVQRLLSSAGVVTGRDGEPAAPGPSSGAGSGTRPRPVPRPRPNGGAIEVHLVVTDDTLLRGGTAPALLTSGPSGSNAAADLVPAPIARDLVREAATVWVRRLYSDPASGQLVSMESTRRVFDGNLRRMLVLRDQTCRTPWCEAPIRHGDHVHPDAAGGPTSLANGQGLCERCNHTRSLPGWRGAVMGSSHGGSSIPSSSIPSSSIRSSPVPSGPVPSSPVPSSPVPSGAAPPGPAMGAGPPDSGTVPTAGTDYLAHTVRTVTPTGHGYDSVAPPLLLAGRPALPRNAPSTPKAVGSTPQPPAADPAAPGSRSGQAP